MVKDDPNRKFAAHILNAGNRGKDLSKQLLAFGRRSLSNIVAFQLEDVVEKEIEFIKIMIPENIAIHKEIEVGLPPVMGMVDEINQVMLNVFINASEAMPQGGDITVSLSRENSYSFINGQGLDQKGDTILLCVQDTGIGMEPLILDQIFDPFFTTKLIGDGSGLGMSVAQGIVAEHKGHIEAESQQGEGTTIRIYFPIPEVQLNLQSLTQSPKHTTPMENGNVRILLLDDDSLVIEFTNLLLEPFGYVVTDFLDSDKAIKSIQEDPTDFDMIITDYGMPKMSGKEFASTVRAINADIPILLFTGYGDLVANAEAQSWGIQGVLTKPFKSSELGDAVTKCFSSLPGNG
ncbi:MAG: response regulator [Pseudomonadales bacterium]|nr:response regulator [Pseudomonadales bacterium]